MKRHVIHILFLFFGVVPSLPAFGVMMGLSTEELTNSSDLIVIGRVQSVKSMWSEDGKVIISRAKIIVNSVITGKWDKDVLNIEYVGGEVGDIGLRVSDVKPLNLGENLLLFLGIHKVQRERFGQGLISPTNEEVYHRIVGNAQGQYTISPQGIARKDGFSVMQGSEFIDNDIPLEVLIDKIRGVKR